MAYNLKALIIQQLKTVFNVKVYDEPIQQGLSTPCFIVAVKGVSRKRLVNQNDKQVFMVQVEYYTHNTQTRLADFERVEQVFYSDQFRYLGDKQYPIQELSVEYDSEVLIVSFFITRYVRWRYDDIKMNDLERSVEFE